MFLLAFPMGAPWISAIASFICLTEKRGRKITVFILLFSLVTILLRIYDNLCVNLSWTL